MNYAECILCPACTELLPLDSITNLSQRPHLPLSYNYLASKRALVIILCWFSAAGLNRLILSLYFTVQADWNL